MSRMVTKRVCQLQQLSGMSAACSMLAVRQQRKPCHGIANSSVLPHDETCSAGRAGMSATGVGKTEMLCSI